jgi:predicted Zn finger-like uncharacterized protein
MSSLATRCPECSTVFRVVPDQLRVSEGWVRCGRCTAVFNAVKHFVELEARPAGAAPLAAPPPPPPPTVPPSPPTSPPTSRFVSQEAPTTASPAVAEPTLDHPHSAFHRYDDDVADDERVRGATGQDAAAGASTHHVDAAPDVEAEADARTAPLPRFVRQADRAARWRSRPVRIASAIGMALLGLLLAGQVALTWRDHLAARVPALQPALAAACGVLDCTLGPPRQIAALAVEGSGLARVEKSSLYKLSLTLKNRSDLALAVPALDLSLTDSDGRLVARRVLSASELGLGAAGGPGTIAAGADLPLQAVLQLDRAAPAVTGYTVELFYP